MIDYTPVRDILPYTFSEKQSDTELRVTLELLTTDGLSFKEVSVFTKEETVEPNFKTKLLETKQLMERRMKRQYDWLMCRLHVSYEDIRAELLKGHNTNEKTN